MNWFGMVTWMEGKSYIPSQLQQRNPKIPKEKKNLGWDGADTDANDALVPPALIGCLSTLTWHEKTVSLGESYSFKAARGDFGVDLIKGRAIIQSVF